MRFITTVLMPDGYEYEVTASCYDDPKNPREAIRRNKVEQIVGVLLPDRSKGAYNADDYLEGLQERSNQSLGSIKWL